MDWEGLQLLLKAPKKKYVRKLMEYSVLVSYSPQAVDPHLNTPISQDFANDLELSAVEAHKLLTAMVGYLRWTRTVQFQ